MALDQVDRVVRSASGPLVALTGAGVPTVPRAPTLLILRKGEMAAQQAGALLPPALRTWVEQALALGDS